MNNEEISVSPPDSLVKFDPPQFVGIEHKRDAAKSATAGTEGGGNKLEDMINAMLQPREWVEESGVWVQYVSKEAASRLDVISLQERLDKKLNERKAREAGICPVREELYGQGFDELIRQVALDGPERGLLLMRVRDEIRMAIDAYKTLYASSVTFGIKKQMKAEQGIPALEDETTALETEKAALELEVQEYRSKLGAFHGVFVQPVSVAALLHRVLCCVLLLLTSLFFIEIIEKREVERKQADEKRRKEELDFLKYQGQHLDSFLKQMSASK